MIAVLGGHIDHGKSTVVAALTGRAMDPLPEERERGITLDLHVVPLDLGNGSTCGLVDVPGHERLVRTMAAGAAGTDALLLVVAADDGVRPQTLEHCAVAAAAGISRGVVALSKTDRVEPGRVREVEDEVARRLAGSGVAFGPVIRLPGDAGVAALVSALRTLAEATPRRASHRPFRMGIDRAFTLPGQGTVVSGTVLDGAVRTGDRLTLLPMGTEVRVRSVHTFGSRRAEAGAGERAGLALAGASPDECTRGTVLVGGKEAWAGSRRLEVLVRVDPGAPGPVQRGHALQLLLGTQEARARAWPASDIFPGQEGPAWLRLDRPVVAGREDRVVLRSIAPVGTVGGAVVMDPGPPAPARRYVGPGESGAVLAELVWRRADGVAPDELTILAPPGGEATPTAGLVQLRGRWHASVAAGEAGRRAAHAARAEPGLGLAELRAMASRTSAALAEHAIDELIRAGELVVREGRAYPPGTATAAPANSDVAALVGAAERAGLEGLPFERVDRAVARAAMEAGLVVALPDGRLVGQEALAGFRQAILAMPRTAEGWEVAAFREVSGLSRRLLIPLLEWTDRMGWTARQGPARVPGPRLA